MNAETNTAAEGEIRAVVDRWIAASRKGDVDAVMACYTPDITAFDAIATLQFKGEAYRAHWDECMRQMNGAEMIFEPGELAISTGGTTAFVHYLCRCGLQPEEGEAETSWMRHTHCLVKTPDGWRIAHEHFSAPCDPESGKALFELEP